MSELNMFVQFLRDFSHKLSCDGSEMIFVYVSVSVSLCLSVCIFVCLCVYLWVCVLTFGSKVIGQKKKKILWKLKIGTHQRAAGLTFMNSANFLVVFVADVGHDRSCTQEHQGS